MYVGMITYIVTFKGPNQLNGLPVEQNPNSPPTFIETKGRNLRYLCNILQFRTRIWKKHNEYQKINRYHSIIEFTLNILKNIHYHLRKAKVSIKLIALQLLNWKCVVKCHSYITYMTLWIFSKAFFMQLKIKSSY